MNFNKNFADEIIQYLIDWRVEKSKSIDLGPNVGRSITASNSFL